MRSNNTFCKVVEFFPKKLLLKRKLDEKQHISKRLLLNSLFIPFLLSYSENPSSHVSVKFLPKSTTAGNTPWIQ